MWWAASAKDGGTLFIVNKLLRGKRGKRERGERAGGATEGVQGLESCDALSIY
jgi:hypothetical protein